MRHEPATQLVQLADRSKRDGDGLELGIALDTVASRFPTDPRLLEAAERKRHVGCGGTIAPHHPGLQLRRQLVHRGNVSGPDGSGKAIIRVVRLSRDFVEIVVASGGKNRPEYLLA